jgi:hypothetical protein
LSIKTRTPYRYNTDKAWGQAFFKGGGNVTALAENGSYGRRRAHVTLMWSGIVYIFSRCCLSLPFLFLSFRSSFIDNPIVQVVRIPFAVLMPRLTESATLYMSYDYPYILTMLTWPILFPYLNVFVFNIYSYCVYSLL